MLNMIDSRLRQIKCKPNDLFGGLSIILVGDFKQLPPVCDTCLWLWDTSKSHHSTNVKSGLAVFSFFKTVVVLKIIVRQEGADRQAFRNCLEKFRMGTVGLAEYEFLRARINGIVDLIESSRF
jgi:ATP-dependent DNA helicase PIF1